MGNKIYPIGIQNFESLRLDGYFYIDKTALIYQLVKSGRYYFLSRPRRFGKSLLISTLEAYFQGKKELFQGLAMEKLEKDWTKYPILHIDLNTQKYDSPQSLESKMNRTLVTKVPARARHYNCPHRPLRHLHQHILYKAKPPPVLDADDLLALQLGEFHMHRCTSPSFLAQHMLLLQGISPPGSSG